MALKRYLRKRSIVFGLGTITGFLASMIGQRISTGIKVRKAESLRQRLGIETLTRLGFEWRNGEFVPVEKSVYIEPPPGGPPAIPILAYVVIGIVGVFVLIKLLGK